MANFQQRRDPVRLMWRRILAVAIFLLLALAVRGAWGVYMKAQDSGVLKAEAEAKLGELEKRELELRTEIAQLRSDRGVESEMRERYDLAAEGESVIVILEPPPAPPEPQPTRVERFRSWFSW